MANPNGNPANLTAPKFKPSESGNPGGKPVGARNRLTAQFLNALADDFEEFGREAIAGCRISNVAAYIKAIAALCPRELEIKRPLQEMEDGELLSAVRALESFLATRANESRISQESGRESVN
jgi:hypothetical protein